MKSVVCARPIHPGELLKDEIEVRNVTQAKLATQIGVSYKMINDIMNCHRAIDAATAMKLEAALGVSADLLLRMQTDYNMQTARQDKSLLKKLNEIRRIAAVL